MTIGVSNPTRELARYETALDLLNMMVAVASANIASEEGNAHPDAKKIAALVQDQVTHRRAALALDPEDSAEVDRVIGFYGALQREHRLRSHPYFGR